MDFHSLSRKELQTLCKKNKIPANITNVAMADALAALPQVEGLDEFLNPREADADVDAGAGTPDKACRTSTRRKAMREEPQSSKVSTRLHRGTRAVNGEGGVEQENKDANVPDTPAVLPSSKRRAPAVSSRRKKASETEMLDDYEKNAGQGKPTDVPITPAAAPSSRTRAIGTSVNTRRSVRLLEKNLSNMSLMDNEDMGLDKIDDVSEEMSAVSQQTGDSVEIEKGKTDELEVSSLEKSSENECQSQDSGSEVKLVSGTENDVEAGLKAEPQEEGLGKGSYLEAEAESHDTNSKGSSETLDDSNGVLECCDEFVDLNESIGEAVHMDNEAGSSLLSELEGSGDSSESVEASEDAIMECTEQDVAVLSVDDASIEVSNQDVAGSLLMSSVSNDSPGQKEFVDLKTNNQSSKEDDGNQDKNNETEHLNMEDSNYNQHFEPMCDVDEKAADEKHLAAIPEGVLVEEGSANICSSGEHQEDELEAESEPLQESMADIEIKDNASDITGASSATPALEKDTNASSEHSIEDWDESSSDKSNDVEKFTLESSLLNKPQEEQLEAKSEHLEESMLELDKLDDAFDVTGASSATLALEKYAKESSGNFIAVMEVCNESYADVENVIVESSLLGVGVHEEDLKDNPDELETKTQDAQPEESKEHAEETALNAAAAFPLSIKQVSGEPTGSSDSCSSDVCVLSCNSNTLQGDSEEIAVQKQEFLVSVETMTIASIHEQKISDIAIQSNVSDQYKRESLCQAHSETKGVANEIHTVPKIIGTENDMLNVNMMKENLTADELHKRSIRELKKMLKMLTIDGKANCKSKSNNVVKEGGRKRTALQALPENRIEAQNDG